jgi:hypothetical protein
MFFSFCSKGSFDFLGLPTIVGQRSCFSCFSPASVQTNMFGGTYNGREYRLLSFSTLGGSQRQVVAWVAVISGILIEALRSATFSQRSFRKLPCHKSSLLIRIKYLDL